MNTTAAASVTEATSGASQKVVLRLRGHHDPSTPRYPRYLPVWEHDTFPIIKEEPYVDAGTRATPDKRHLLKQGTTTRNLSPGLGTELRGVQLSSLTNEGLDDLALFVAERGFVIFRDQDFKDLSIERQAQIVQHYGRLHIHPTECHPAGQPGFRVVYHDPSDKSLSGLQFGGNRPDSISSTSWHTDHSAELQPPGITFFWALEVPDSGGDTVFSSQTIAYEKLSEDFKKRLEGLKVIHDNTGQIQNSRSAGGPVRLQPVIVEHPLVRTHPATGKKSLWIHGFAQRIVGWKKEESDYLLKFLDSIVTKSVDFQARANYDDRTVVVWDNRILSHTATRDWNGPERRHMIRAAAHAEVPKE